MKLTEMLMNIIVKHSFTLSANDDWQEIEPKPTLETRLADGTTIKLHGEFDFSGVTLGDALDKAVATARIAWQGSNRGRFGELVTGDTVKIMVATAGKAPVIDPMMVLKQRYADAETDEDRQALLDEIIGADADEAGDEAK